MKRTPFGTWPCSIARAVDLLGDWWTPLVLREAVFGVRRFEEFQRPPRHAKWREVNLAAQVPGWTRFGVAQEMLSRRGGTTASR